MYSTFQKFGVSKTILCVKRNLKLQLFCNYQIIKLYTAQCRWIKCGKFQENFIWTISNIQFCSDQLRGKKHCSKLCWLNLILCSQVVKCKHQYWMTTFNTIPIFILVFNWASCSVFFFCSSEVFCILQRMNLQCSLVHC